MALGDRIVVAIAGWRRQQPLLGGETAQVGLRNDIAIDFTIDAIELIQSLHCHRYVAPAKINPLNLAVLPVAQAEPSMPYRGKRRLFEAYPVELQPQRTRKTEEGGLRTRSPAGGRDHYGDRQSFCCLTHGIWPQPICWGTNTSKSLQSRSLRRCNSIQNRCLCAGVC